VGLLLYIYIYIHPSTLQMNMATMSTKGNGKVTTVSRHHAIKVHRCVKVNLHALWIWLQREDKNWLKNSISLWGKGVCTPCPSDLMALTACQESVLKRQILLDRNHPAPPSSHYWLCYPIWWNVDTLHLWGQQFLCDVWMCPSHRVVEELYPIQISTYSLHRILSDFWNVLTSKMLG